MRQTRDAGFAACPDRPSRTVAKAATAVPARATTRARSCPNEEVSVHRTPVNREDFAVERPFSMTNSQLSASHWCSAKICICTELKSILQHCVKES